MAKLHYMPFYGLDFYADEPVRLMTRVERDIYMELLWCQWREGSIPADPDDLRRLVRDKVSDRVLACFPPTDDGRRRNGKLEEIRKHHQDVSAARSKVGKQGAKAKQLRKQGASKPEAIAVANGQAKPKQLETELEKDIAERRNGAIRVTWLTPYAEAWRAQYGGEPHPGKLAKHLSGPRKAVGDENLLPRWRRYLLATDAQYASPARFAETHGKYTKSEVRVMTDENGVDRPHEQLPDGTWAVLSAPLSA